MLATTGQNGSLAEEWQEAFRMLTPEMLDQNYQMVVQYCGIVQEGLNKRAGLGLKAVTPNQDRDRVEGITQHVTGAKDAEQAAARLAVDTDALNRHYVDESVRENADFHYRSGIRAMVERVAAPNCCQWCAELAGEYSYAEVKQRGSDVWRRHANCGCLILYDPADGGGKTQVNNYARKERLHADAERELAAKRASVPAGHADAAPEKLRERAELPGGHPDVTPGGKTLDISGNGGIINEARAIDSMFLADDVEDHKFTPQSILEELQRSPIGLETIRHIRDSRAVIEIIDEPQWHSDRGLEVNGRIKLFAANIGSQRIAGQTVIHEMTHYWYQIGGCQHAEAVCFAMEKMHLLKRDYLTQEEWESMVKLAVENYGYQSWEDGGYGDFSQFSFVR